MRMHGHYKHGPRGCGSSERHGMGPMAFAMKFGSRGRGAAGFGGDWGEIGEAFSRAFGEGPGRRHRRGGPGGRMFAGGELRLVLLALIAEQSRHGYELIKAIEELTGGNYAPSPGVVYPTLSLLQDEGAVDQIDDGGTRRAYAVSQAGRAELDERKDEAEALLARLKALGEDAEERRDPAIGRALKNLFGAFRGRMARGEVDRETIHAIVDIIDEAARKIERI
ncbi:PadR family transcriptional regulator [Novosphingobium tardum]|uniref:PadR family transcriptional regulator n=1 Tax=Novosphingobium tardum TaxID=1538021 RepID=A0ABV8RP84_9SPHN